jgi:hypothetical protein
MSITEPIDAVTDEQFELYVLRILQRELGVYGFVRFLRTFRASSGDYTRDRHLWLDGVTIEQILAELPPA